MVGGARDRCRLVGPQEVSKFRMIERHYFRNELVKSYDFTFGFCFPNSTNSWDAVYSMPPLEVRQASDTIHRWSSVNDHTLDPNDGPAVSYHLTVLITRPDALLFSSRTV